MNSLYRNTQCPRTRLRAQMVLLSSEGRSVAEIAAITRQSDDTVRRWLHRFLDQGWRGLLEAPRSGRPALITPAVEQFLAECLQKTPRDFRISRPSWTTALLATVVQRRLKIKVSDECVRQHLERVEGVCRRPPGPSSIGHARSPATLKKRLDHKGFAAPAARADVYVQDEAELSLFPTLTRMWTGLKAVRGQQRKIRAPGLRPPKRHECAATDWRTGEIVRVRSKKRNAEAFCRLVEKCMARSASRKRRVIIVTDGAGFHTPKGSRRVRQLLEHYGPRLKLPYTPAYSPECMPMEQLWAD